MTPAPRPVGLVPLLRRLRSEWQLPLAVFVVVTVVATAAAALPRHLERSARASLTELLTTAPPADRAVVGQGVDVLPLPGGDPLAGVRRLATEARRTVPPALDARLAPTVSVVDTSRYVVTGTADGGTLPHPTRLTFRAHEGIDEHLELVAGRLPRAVRGTTADGDAPDELPGEPVPVEVLLSPRTAEELGAGLGAELLARPDPDDDLVRRRPITGQVPVLVRVVGLAELSEHTGSFWLGDARLHRPARRETGFGVELFAFAVATPETLRSLPDVARQQPVRLQHRAFLAGDELPAEAAVELRDAVRRLEAASGSVIGTTTWRSGLGTLLERHLDRVAGAGATATLAFTGVLALALVLVVLVAVLVADRRRRVVALVRGRGAAAAQLLGAQLVEALATTVPAVLLGLSAARALVPGAEASGAAPAAGVGAATVLVLLGAAWPDAVRPLGALARSRSTTGRPGRWTAELLLVALAVLAVTTLRRRGLDLAGGAGGTDPLLVLAPVLLAGAAAVVAVRAQRRPLRLAGDLAARGRSAATWLGLLGGARSDRAGVPLAVLLLATTVSVVAVSLDATVRAGQVEASWRAVGAPHRIDAPAGEELTAEQVETLVGTGGAREHRATVPVIAPAAAVDNVTLTALDVARHRDVTRGTPAADDLPTALAAPAAPDDARLPAVVARRWAAAHGLRVGDALTVRIGIELVEVRIAALRERVLDLGDDTGFVLVDLARLSDRLGTVPGSDRVYVGGRPPAAVEELRTSAAAAGATLRDRAEVLDAARTSALTAGTLAVLRGAAVLALALTALALQTSLAMTSRQRGRDLSLLRLLGASRRSLVRTRLVETLPAILVAVVLGSALGAVTVASLRRPLDLAALTADASVVLGVPAGAVAAIAAGVATAAVALAVAHAAAATTRDPSTTLQEP